MKECPQCHKRKPEDAFRKGRVCKACEYEKQLKWKAENKDRYNERRAAWRRQKQAHLYIVAREALGNKCAHCGITDLRVLDIDHINGGGSEERRQRDRLQILNRIIDGSKDYQLLCCNCHRIKTLH